MYRRILLKILKIIAGQKTSTFDANLAFAEGNAFTLVAFCSNWSATMMGILTGPSSDLKRLRI
jgi:hypothetical protein